MFLSFWNDPSAIVPSILSLITLGIVSISAFKVEGLKAKYNSKNYRKQLFYDYEFQQVEKLITLMVETLNGMVNLISRIDEGDQYIKDRKAFSDKFSSVSEISKNLFYLYSLTRILLSHNSEDQIDKSVEIILEYHEIFSKIVIDPDYKPEKSKFVEDLSIAHNELREFIDLYKKELD